MHPRILDEKRKFTYYRLSWEDREKIIADIVEYVRGREEILLAIVYGGFLDSKIFRDIDLAVYTMYRIPMDNAYRYEYMLSDELTKKIKIPVDVVLLDYAPIWFKRKVLEKGRVVYERYKWVKTKLDYTLMSETIDMEIKRRIAKGYQVNNELSQTQL